METDRISGKVGVFRSYDPGDCTLKVLADDVLFEEESIDWQYEFSQQQFRKLGENVCTANRSIKLVFISPEQADGFEGVLFTGLQ